MKKEGVAIINEKFENIISLWLRCEITGDGAMSEIVKILNEEEKDKDEVVNGCTKE